MTGRVSHPPLGFFFSSLFPAILTEEWLHRLFEIPEGPDFLSYLFYKETNHRVEKAMGTMVGTGGRKANMFIFIIEEENFNDYYRGNNMKFLKSTKNKDIVQI